MHGEPPLPVTPTHSGNEAKGTILGLEGMAVVPVISGAILTILLLVILVPGSTTALFPRVVLSLGPVATMVAYVLLFVHKKPPNYRRDSFELYRGQIPLIGRLFSPWGLAFNAGPEPLIVPHPRPVSKPALVRSSSASR